MRFSNALIPGFHLAACLSIAGGGCVPFMARAQAADCNTQPQAPQCRSPQIAGGALVPVNVQRQLGLVTVNGGCSGTLLTRYWVLTARHCATTNGLVAGPLLAPGSMRITATWAAQRVVPVRLYEFAVNRGVATPGRDMILIRLDAPGFGVVPDQPLHVLNTLARPWVGQRLATTDTVSQYGRGYSTFATGIFGTASAVPAAGLGTYRTADFQPSAISQTQYQLNANGSGQVGHGGDSGGPTRIVRAGISYVAGVQSTCVAAGYIPGTPSPGTWPWATGIRSCQYVSVEPMAEEIRLALLDTPECKLGAACAMPAILNYLLQ